MTRHERSEIHVSKECEKEYKKVTRNDLHKLTSIGAQDDGKGIRQMY